MKLEAIYNQGKLEFLSPVTLIHDKFKLEVNIPEEEIIKHHQPNNNTPKSFTEYNLSDQALQFAEKLKNGLYQKKSEIINIETSQKQQQRWDAFALRDG